MKNNHGLIKHFRQWSVRLSMLLLMIQMASAQNITRIEYFFDIDPGFGSGTAVTGYTSSPNVSAYTFPASIASLSSGFHTLYIRSRDANNKWSLTNNTPFIKYAAQSGTPSAGNINKLEYFVDTDPGVGLATNVPVTASADIAGQVFAVPLASYSYGFHTLYVRSRDVNNKWSLTNYGVFIKFQAPTGPSAAGNINKLEYFVDTDPGVGLATNVPVTAAADIAGQVVAVPITSYGYGFHTIYFRSRDTNGKWSLTNYGSFIRYQSQTAPSANGNIVKLEYFVDADPGFGAGTNIPVTAALDISGQVASINISALANGFHTIYLRSKDINGKWSLTNYGSFIKYAAQTASTAAAGNVIKMEYFVDTDPGFGNGGNIPFTHSANVSGLVATIDLTSVANGFHTMYIRSMDTLHKWSLTNYATFTGGQLQAPTASITVNGSSTFCLGSGTYLSANYSASATYQWKLNGNTIGGATSITYIPTQSGSYTVVVTNAISSATSSAVTITVNPVPTATISANGVLTFCQGGSVTLSVNATANATYQWHLNGGNIGGATTTSYVANQSGVYDVRVLSNNGCATTSAYDTVTVNPSPSATITPGGNTTFCSGDSVTLYGNTGSGLTYHWSNNASTSSIKVIASGNYSLTVTNSSNCSASAAAVAVTVLAAPSATITPNGATTFCNGSSVVLAANTGAGLSYLWSGGAITSSITVSSSGTYYVTVSNAGCSRVSTPVTVTVNPGPVVGINGTSSTVCQGHTDTLTATGATTYAWAGVGLNTYTGATVYATPSLTTTYSVTGTTSGCIGTATFTVNINANNTSVSTTTPTICSGSGAVLNAAGASTYAWSPSGTLSSATGASVTASPLSQTTYTVTGTSGTCTSTATITINVNTTVVPSVTVTTPQTSVCAGTSITFTAAATNGGSSPTFQWYKNGVIQIGTTSTFATASLANNDSVWCIMTSNAPCPLPTSAASNHVHMTVNAVVTPTITIAVDQNPVCVNTAVTFTATITNGGATPVYQWKKNNVTVGSNSATYLLSSPANNDSVWCILTSNALCASPVSVTSSKIKMVVNQISAPTVTVSPSQNPICANTTVVFSTTQTNGGSSPSYQWYKNGNVVGFNSDNYTDNALATSDSVWCVMTSNATCASPLMATSNKVVITIAANVTPSVIVSTPQTSVCAGTSITFTAAPTNGGFAPTYQWYKNGVLQAGNTDTYVSVVLNNDSVWCVMTSNALCSVPATGTSNKVHMTVNATVTPTITIVSSVNTICAGDSVTFTATITNGGVTPIYQWKKNNVNVGNGTSIYGTTTLVAGDSVWCVLTSSAACPSPASVISNKKKIVVNAIVVPTIAVTASQNPICTGASVTFTTSITHGGGSPGYQWYKNNVPVGINSSSYTDNALAADDSVWCVLTSSAGCASPTIVTSNKIVIAITPTVVPSVTISISSSTICSGTSAVFTASAVNGGSPTYQWYENTVLQAGNTNTFTNSGIADGDSVWCVMTSHAQCPSPATAISDTIHMTVNPILVPTVTVTASQSTSCAGDSITFTTVITNGGANPVYQWKKNNGNVGSGLDFYGTTALSNNDSVWCVLTSTALCASPSTITSNKTHMTVNPIVAPTVSVSASANPACEESSVTFTATTSNEGSAPDYQWYKNGNIVGVSSSSYTDNGLVNNDSVWCVLTSNASCASVTVVSSSNVTMTVLPNVVPAVSVSSTDTTLCAGVAVDFTAAATNGGASPSYSWYKNGILQAGNTGTYTDATLVNNDSVWCVMTSNEACPSPATASATGVTVTVLQPAYYSFSHSICQGESYPFHSLNLTAGGTYNDTLAASNGCDSITTLTLTVHQLPNPVITQNGNTLSAGVYTSYQWLLNGDTIVGATAQSYNAMVSGTYTVQVTDGNGCGNTATAVTVVTGIENVSLVNLLVYPNPTENTLHVRADNLTGVARIELHDDLGRLLFEKEVRGNAIREELDLSNYASGVYLLVIKNSDKTLATRRFFKN